VDEERRTAVIDCHDLELVAAYLGATPDEVARQLRRGVPLETVAERYGRPRVGVEELLATTLARR
jgi:hypothetical protein